MILILMVNRDFILLKAYAHTHTHTQKERDTMTSSSPQLCPLAGTPGKEGPHEGAVVMGYFNLVSLNSTCWFTFFFQRRNREQE